MATVNLHNKFCEDQSSSHRDMLTDRHTDRQTDRNIPIPYWGAVTIVKQCVSWEHKPWMMPSILALSE